jgi:hypothetical protein
MALAFCVHKESLQPMMILSCDIVEWCVWVQPKPEFLLGGVHRQYNDAVLSDWEAAFPAHKPVPKVEPHGAWRLQGLHTEVLNFDCQQSG